jgi:TatD DNase family protein
MIVDTHCHLDQDEFEQDRDEVLARAREAGVCQVIAIGTTAESSAKCVQLAALHEGVFAAVGIQPNYVAQAKDDDWDRVVALSRSPRVVALGETGLDRYWDYAPFELQQDYFDRHVRLSQETGLPFVVHMRDCEEDVLVMLRDALRRGTLAGVMHSFTGTAGGARECLELGLYVSFAGMVTYKKSDELRSIAALVPDDRILIETDAPYLSPEPVRKVRRNEPAHLRHTAERLAAVRNTSIEEFARVTTANARRLFGLNE